MVFEPDINDQLELLLPLHLKKKVSFLFFSQVNSRKPTSIKSSTVQTLNVPLKETKTLLLETENIELLFTDKVQTHILSKLQRCFSFMENLPKNSEHSCSVVHKENYKHSYTTFWNTRLFWIANYHNETSSISNKRSKYTHSFGSSYLSHWYNWTN